MRILLSWLRDFVPVTAPADEVGRALSMCGFELAAVEPCPDGLIARTGGRGQPGDAVLDFEITANRPDCLSVLGMAREVATFTTPLRQPSRHAGEADIESPDQEGERAGNLTVRLEDPEGCPRYAAAVVDVTVRPHLPGSRTLAGRRLRPINNVVDVTTTC